MEQKEDDRVHNDDQEIEQAGPEHVDANGFILDEHEGENEVDACPEEKVEELKTEVLRYYKYQNNYLEKNIKKGK